MSRGLVRALWLGASCMLLVLASASDASAQVSTQQYNALLAIYNATGGPTTWVDRTGWGGPINTVCGTTPWYGIACDSSNQNVTGIYLQNNGLTGTLPSAIGQFPLLVQLDVSGNQITGQVPAAIGSLTQLQDLSLHTNLFSGPIPDVFTTMPALRSIYMCCNAFSGSLPQSISALSQLQVFYAYQNQLTGLIPQSYGSLTSLRELFLEGNGLSGQIPATLGGLLQLSLLDLAGNDLSGNIPTQLGQLTALQTLDLSGNQLTGGIPVELGNLVSLRSCELQFNGATFGGTIPSSIGNLANLQSFQAQWNGIGGSIPPEIGQLGNLQYLDLSNNNLTGPIPPEIGNLAAAESIYLNNNFYSGGIPSAFGAGTNLRFLQNLGLSEAQLTGPIPPEMGNMTALVNLWLHSNNLSGNIPTQLGQLVNLRLLFADNNNLSGNIPTQLGQLVNLEELTLHDNLLTGPIPGSFGSLANLQVLQLYNNQLSGNIPTQLGQLANLRVLYANNNLLTGPIPASFGGLTNLRELKMYENQLSGNIPTQLGQLANLQQIELYRNSLSGNIPTQLGQLTSLQTLYIGGNALSGDLPTSLAGLPLVIDGLDLGYNLVSTNDAALRAFLNSRQIGNDFEATQTLAPASLSSTGSTQTSADLSWPIIRYSSDAGAYHVLYGTDPGSYPSSIQTPDKTVTTATLTGLERARTYHAVVQTETQSHVFNPNRLLSGLTSDLVFRTAGCFGLAPATLPSGYVGDAFNQTITASGGTPPYVFEVDDGTLPTGLTLSAGGVLSGTLGAAGTFIFTIRAEDSTSCAGAQDYSVTVTADVNHVVGQGLGSPNANRVRVYDEAGVATSTDFLAYSAGRWGVNVATGEINGGNDDIVTGPGPGDVFGPQVKAFLRDGTPVAKVNFFAYGTLKFGVNVAAGALDADGFEEILTGAGSGAVFGPHVRAWNFDATTLTVIAKVNFFAYSTLKFGVNVAAGQVDADAFAEILTAPGPGQIFTPQVRGFNFDGGTVASMGKISFLAFTTGGFGASLASADVDADGFEEIVASPGPGGGPVYPARFRGFDFDGVGIASAPGYDVTPFPTFYGGRPGLGDIDRDGRAELFAGAGRDPNADSTVQRHAYDGTQMSPLAGAFVPFGTARYGVNVAGGGLGY